MQDKLLIVTKIKKTIDYVNNVLVNYPKSEYVIRNNISDCFYSLLELIYRANIYKDIFYMKESIVKIRMIEYYLKISLDKKIISFKKYENIGGYLLEINKILKKYKLKLNRKTKIYSYKEGFEFLGFRYIIKNNKAIMKVKNSTKKRFKYKVKLYRYLLSNNKISKNDYNQVIASYNGHLSYGNTNNLVYSNLSKSVIK